jgi:hypothetical protein
LQTHFNTKQPVFIPICTIFIALKHSNPRSANYLLQQKMCKQILLIIIAVCVSLAVIAKENPSVDFKQQKHPTISFTENKGQFADQNYNPRPDVLFGGSDGQMAFHITGKGISYQLYRVDKYKEVEEPKTTNKIKEIEQQTIYRTDIKWLNANPDPIIRTDEVLPGYTNYYLEQCPKGALQVKSYKGITLQNIYKNIDLHYYEKKGQLKYDYIVAPNADYKQIQLKVEGATLKLMKDGSLLIETPLGKIQEQAPLVYQNGKQLKARYIIKNNCISFEIENYDSNYELIIDPVTRLWGTYYGGPLTEYASCCSTDGSGNVFMSGFTNCTTSSIIATVGSHQSSLGGSSDAYLVKFNSNGVRQWGTYYGGSSGDRSTYCATDPAGNVYMIGYTNSNTGTVIATSGSHQDTFGGGPEDVFLVKFNSNGIRQWATYYGGTGSDWPYTCTTDASGNVYITGFTYSSSGTVIATSGSHQDTYAGSQDAFLAKFDSNGLRLWGTYYGGTGDDVSRSCATDASGNVYITGVTDSNTSTLIATNGSHQNTLGGLGDAFLVKFNSSGVRLWGTYYGGVDAEHANGCSTDVAGNIYITGGADSSSVSVITTAGCHQSIHAGGFRDAFLVKFNSGGLRLWGTYYGGEGLDGGESCTTDASGNVYLAGITQSTIGTSIATIGSHQAAYGGGNRDAFLVKFNSSGMRQSGTYYGGWNADDHGYSCATDASGKVYMAGYTESTTGTVIASAGSHQSTSGGPTSAYLVKFDNCNGPSQPSTITGSVLVCSGASQTYSVTNDAIATSYVWSLPGGWSGISSINIILTTAGATGILTVTAINPCGPSPQQTLNVTVNPSPNLTANTNNTLICLGQMAILTASGAVNYTWNPGAATGASISITPSTSTVYTVTGIAANGCLSTTTVSQSAVDCTGSLEADIENADVLVYPNPFSGMVTIIGAEGTTLTIYNSMGQLICNTKIKESKTEINLSKEPKGIYFVRVNSIVRKILKE